MLVFIGRDPSAICVCVKHNCTYIIVRVFLFQIIMCTQLQSITVQCVSARVDLLANMLNSLVELLISGRGKKVDITENRRERVRKAMDRLPDVSYLS